MGHATSAELASRRGETKISNYTGRAITLIITGTQVNVVRRSTTRASNFGIEGQRGAGGGLSFGSTSSTDASYLISEVHSMARLDYRRPEDTIADGNDDSGRGIMYHIGPKKWERFYITVFIDGTPRLINGGFQGGNSIVFQSGGTITYRDEMNFNGRHPQVTCGNWNIPIDVAEVDAIPPGFRELRPLNGS